MLFLCFRYISILPSISLSIIIAPADAIELRVPGYKAKVTRHPPRDKNQNSVINQNETVVTTVNDDLDRHDDTNTGQLPNELRGFQTSEMPMISQKEPDFFSEEYLRKYYPYMDAEQLKKLYYPKSRLEFLITVSLGFLTVICITYFMMVLYRCMCTRKYSKWRASWNKIPKSSRGNSYYKQIKEAVPLILRGHMQVQVLILCS